MRAALVMLLLAPGVAAADPTVFVDGGIGAAAARETAPALVDGSPQLVGHAGVGVRLGAHLSLSIATALGRGTYANTLEAPAEIAPETRMTMSRYGAGLRALGHAPLGPIELTVGAGAFVHRARLGADGRHTTVGITGEYAHVDDTALGLELAAGASMRPWSCGRVGLRFVWSRLEAELPEDADLGGLSIELFVQADLLRSPTAAGGATIGCAAGRPR